MTQSTNTTSEIDQLSELEHSQTIPDYGVTGPYPVGTTTQTLPDGKSVAIYYPADKLRLDNVSPYNGYSSVEAFPEAFQSLVPSELLQTISLTAFLDAPIAPNTSFPIVLHSHGFGGYLRYSSQHYFHLASWGYVVAAPDHTARNLSAALTDSVKMQNDPDVADLIETYALLKQEQNNPTTLLYNKLPLDQVVAEGHSAGGRAVVRLALEKEIPLTAVIGQAPSVPLTFDDMMDKSLRSGPSLDAKLSLLDPPSVPVLYLTGKNDGVVELSSVEQTYGWLRAPKQLIVFENVGHGAFIDICSPIRTQGGLSQFADKFGSAPEVLNLLRLGEDGCLQSFVDPVETQTIVNAVTVTYLQSFFAPDQHTRELHTQALGTDALIQQFGSEVFSSIESESSP